MDYKRSVTQTASKVPPSKSSMLKTKSEVSLTPSQMAELEKQNARKSPLDALSRTVIRPQGFERRSGLQDVDESYLKKNVFTKPLFSRNSGLGEAYAGNSNAAPAAGAQMANIRQTGGGGYVDVAQGSVAQANMYTQQQSQQPPQMQAQVQMGQQQNAPVQIQQAHNIPAAGAASGHGHAHRQQMHHQQHVQQQHAQQQHAHQQHAQAQQAQYQQQQHQQQAQLAQQQQAQYQQQQQQAQLAQQQQQAQYQQQQQQQQQPQYQQQQPAQYQQQQAQHAQNAQQVQQQVPPQQQQQYQQQAPPAATQPGTNSVPPTPEPEMCTTCPNCQTTIYLVRGNDTNYDGSLPPVQQ
ncbi:putative cyclin-dependent serine/threonine-protein kinase DDB_G0272797/DDB_G0274007 [Teleopsis dalmanni]|uniref:putative cyclin-dependent serine/threonine-protein kinase DDB_G0272797/DDB_G0274007 n=1 Tax=Teleopsis dalmanni TaxID=139649 RepID=UPI0018CFA553|nr:putative cyclin-dependent serine/threonine-protein kinase DDB_G0272797/DDB_G0274007 [Teleopsis dalmanni]